MTILLASELVAGFGESFKISLGRGEDKHLLRIAGDPSGLFRPSRIFAGRQGKEARYVRFILPRHERFPACPVPLRETSFERDEKKRVLLITLPAWAWDEKVKRDMETAPPPVKLKKAA
jgi:hypothetical protein